MEEEDLQNTLLEPDYQNKDHNLPDAEPLYTEPDFINSCDSSSSYPPGLSYTQSEHLMSSLLPADLASIRPPDVSSPESGYSSAKPPSSSQGYTSRETSDDDEDQFFHFHTGTVIRSASPMSNHNKIDKPLTNNILRQSSRYKIKLKPSFAVQS